MIVFDKLWTVMQAQDVSTYQLREKCGIDSKTIRRLRANENMETKTLNKLCAALHCGLGDIAEYVPALLRHRSGLGCSFSCGCSGGSNPKILSTLRSAVW